MASKSLPCITEQQIKQWTSAQSFDRGDRYYQQGAIFNASRQGTDIRAECQGSRLYHVQATLEPGNVTDARCRCPYDRGGLCKHLVALLLTYVRNPNAVQVIPPMAELLKSCKREELVSLIEQMVQQDPDLLYLVEISAPQPAGQVIDVSTYRRKVQSALGLDQVEDILTGLKGVEKAAEQLQQRQDWLNAGVVYQMLLAEITDVYDEQLQSIDYNGDVACVVQDAIAGLGRSLEHTQNLDRDLRQDWLNTLLDSELNDFELGGIDFAYGATKLLFDLATDAEWQALEARILAEIEYQRDGWQKEQLIKLLAKHYKQSGEEVKASALIHESGTPQQQAFLLVQEGKFAAAIAIAEVNFSNLPGVVTRFADALVEANQPGLALQYMTQQQEHASFRGYRSWLSNFHRSHGNPELALEIDTQEFQTHPSLPSYLELRTLARSLNQWDLLQSKLIQQLEQGKQWIDLIDIALEEGENDRAFQLLSQADAQVKFSRAAAVANAIESIRPQDAIALYTQLAESAIAQKSRSAYQTAAAYLKRAKKLQSPDDWNAYIRQIRTTYSRLPALQDEFNRAKL